jgi:hypothetical protein
MTVQHLSIDELADAADGLLDPERRPSPSRISPDVRNAGLNRRPCTRSPGCCAPSLRCPCRRRWLTAERCRCCGERQAYRCLETEANTRHLWRKPEEIVQVALGAARARRCGGGGCGRLWGYLISASAGLNEPPVVAAVHSSDWRHEPWSRPPEASAHTASPKRGPAPARSLTGVSPALRPAGWMARRHCWLYEAGRVNLGHRGNGLRIRHPLRRPLGGAAALTRHSVRTAAQPIPGAPARCCQRLRGLRNRLPAEAVLRR